MYHLFIIDYSGSSDHLNESYSDQGEGESPVKGGRMTRLRARGGIRDRPPIIDDDDDDLFRAAPPVQPTRKRKAGAGRKPVVEKVVERIGRSNISVQIEQIHERAFNFLHYP